MRLGRYRSALGEAIRRRNAWMAIALVLAVTDAALVAWLHRVDLREKTILVPPVLERAVWVHGDTLSPEYLEQMALYFAGLALTYHPDNVAHQVRLFLRHADPRAHGALSARLEADVARVRESHLASVFYPQSVRTRGHDAVLTGELRLLVGQQSVESRRASFRLGFAYRDGRLHIAHFEEIENHAGTPDRARAAGGT
ncbi:MAG: type IV conjugative transfer system protein TraE [Chromatiales bacterium]|nr:type IV conjugative transfer system protein TraE [Chromatiales bacterium]